MKTKFYVLVIYQLFLVICFSCNNSDTPGDGVKTFHFPNSDDVEQTVEYKNGRKNGYLKEYYRDGTLKARQFYVNDTLDDSTLFFHSNGRLKFIQVFKNKLKTGCWRQYNKSGVMYSEMYFKNDLVDSTCSEYTYQTHQLISRVNFKSGTKDGADEQFYKNGRLKSREIYDRGKICKGTEEWLENGDKIDNDFKITITESDKVFLENTLVYKIELSNPNPDDRVYKVINPDSGNKIGDLAFLEKKGNVFILELIIPKGGFLMETIEIAAFKKTNFGNTFVKTKAFKVASNNF